MKRLVWIMRGLDAVLVIVGLVLLVVGHGRVVTHWNGNGVVDATGPRYMVFTIPVVLVVYGEVSLWLARRRRRVDGLEGINVMLANEWRYVGGAVVLTVIGLITMPLQVGLHLF